VRPGSRCVLPDLAVVSRLSVAVAGRGVVAQHPRRFGLTIRPSRRRFVAPLKRLAVQAVRAPDSCVAARLNSGVRVFMKWREPWSVSIKQQARFNLLERHVLKSAVLWSAMFAVIAVVANLGEDVSVQLERLHRLWFAPALGFPLAVFIYAVNWISPRQIDSGPNGIVVVKGQSISLIPWGAIEHYTLGREGGFNVLHVTDTDGGGHRLFLSAKVHPKEVERELVKHTGKHPNNSSKPTPLRGAA
jgi:hypothetical protein